MSELLMHWTASNIPSLAGKNILVTGANAGIGFNATLGFVHRGAHVIMTGRDSAKLLQAKEKIDALNLKGTTHTAIIDLSNLENVRLGAAHITAAYQKIDVLVNNAGVMIPPAQKTTDGFEWQFGVNYLAHFCLTAQLFSVLKNSNAGRIISVSSISHRNGQIDFENLRLEKPYENWREYRQSKLANLMFCLTLHEKLKVQSPYIKSIGCHPGVSKTELQRYADPHLLDGYEYMDGWQGALPIIYAAAHPQAIGGNYYGPDGKDEINGYPAKAEISEQALDKEVRNKLWKYSENHSGVKFTFTK